MLNCREVTDCASNFVDATLPWRARLQVRLHLLMCRFCREYIRQIRLVARTLRRLPPQEPSAAVRTDLLKMFRTERERR